MKEKKNERKKRKKKKRRKKEKKKGEKDFAVKVSRRKVKQIKN